MGNAAAIFHRNTTSLSNQLTLNGEVDYVLQFEFSTIYIADVFRVRQLLDKIVGQTAELLVCVIVEIGRDWDSIFRLKRKAHQRVIDNHYIGEWILAELAWLEDPLLSENSHIFYIDSSLMIFNFFRAVTIWSMHLLLRQSCDQAVLTVYPFCEKFSKRVYRVQNSIGVDLFRGGKNTDVEKGTHFFQHFKEERAKEDANIYCLLLVFKGSDEAGLSILAIYLRHIDIV